MKERVPTRKMIARFNVRPSRRARLYCKVTIWRDVKALAEESRRQGYSFNRNCVATAHGIEHPQFPNMFAEVDLAAGYLHVEYVSHEFVHAALAYMRRKGWDVDKLKPRPDRRETDGPRANRTTGYYSGNPTEEGICYAQGRMLAAYIRQLRAHGLRVEDMLA